MSVHRRNAKRDSNERDICDYLEARGCVVKRLSGQAIPDLLVGFCGWWLLLEVKAKGGTLTPDQHEFHMEARHRGLPCYIVRSIDDATEICDRVQRLQANYSRSHR